MALAEFYRTEATVDVGGVTFSSPPLIDKDEILVEWRLFKRVFLQEAKLVMEEKKTTKPTLQEVKFTWKHLELTVEFFQRFSSF